MLVYSQAVGSITQVLVISSRPDRHLGGVLAAAAIATRRQCQFIVKRLEKRPDLTVALEQQPCGVQVMELVGSGS